MVKDVAYLFESLYCGSSQEYEYSLIMCTLGDAQLEIKVDC